MSENVSVNGIMELLQNGVSADEIAKTFTKALNEANTKYAEAQKERDTANQKRVAAKKIVVDMLDYCKKYAADVFDDLDVTDEEINEASQMLVEAIDEMVGSLKAVSPLLKVIDKKAPDKGENVIDPIAKFLRDAGL